MDGFVLRQYVAAATASVVLAACGAAGTTTTTQRVAAVPAPDPPRCVPAAIHHGAPPSWTAAAWSDSPGFRVPYALATDEAAAAFFFARKLRAGHPENPSNKVLWIVRFPRNGHPLRITARLGRDPADVVRSTWSAGSDPGEIYPSGIDLPKPGCWHLALAWGSHRASVDIEIHPAGRG
jgi:hypothetical protein